MTPPYIELHARSAFSFLAGASDPEALSRKAAELEISAVALCDRNGVYGAERFYAAGEETKVRAIVGAELELEDGSMLPVLVESRTGYANLCRLITKAKLRGRKDHAPICWEDLPEFREGLVALTGDEDGPVRRCLERGEKGRAAEMLQRLLRIFGGRNVYMEIQRHFRRGEKTVNQHLIDLAAAERVPLLATNGVLYATQESRPVLDVFTVTRLHTTLDRAGTLLAPNGERHLKPAPAMQRIFKDLPQALSNTLELGGRLEFSLNKLGYEFPSFATPDGESMDAFLRKVTMEGAQRRYKNKLTERVRAQLERELALIIKLGFSGYFLIVWDLVNFCIEQNILVQGRGSAANSAVCYSLGITACDPIAYELLFERFLSEGRTSWPDIDLDLPSGERRERVIQEMYLRYGKTGAAMTANVISYRGRSAMREIGKALGFEPETLNRFSHLFANGDFPHTIEVEDQLRQAGLERAHPRALTAAQLYRQIYGLPRHLGQHSGGIIISKGKLDSVVPIEHATMPGRTVAQWDKDSCENMGIIKIDLLGLGMMSVLQDSLELCSQRGRPIDLADLPQEDTATYDMLCAADTVGVFQVESRAQMATLPRMLPRRFYDLVVEVAIIRPGPIQGHMVHPYIARRQKKEPVTYLDDRLIPILKRTLGVPLFQEQVLRIAMVLGNYSGAEAEQLRRGLSSFRSPKLTEAVCATMRLRMAENGCSPEVIEEMAKAVQSFALYAFPESHAISFALIAYASSYLKVHRTAEFFTGLLNNQPMGFYAPATLVADAKRHGVRTLPVSVLESEWLCQVIDNATIRLGLTYARGMTREEGERIVNERAREPFASLIDFQVRTKLSRRTLRVLSKMGALHGLTDTRREAQWQVEIARPADDLFARVEAGATLPLPDMSRFERMSADYSSTGMTLGPHPMKLIRSQLSDCWKASELKQAKTGTRVLTAGNIICRQRPGTAQGFVFLSLEDETGISNVVVQPRLFEKLRLLITEERFLYIEGIVQNIDNVLHVRANAIWPLPYSELALPASHDFH